MQILSAEQIRSWDRFTIEHTPISSIDLMERAAFAFCQKFQSWYPEKNACLQIFCGPGNNGGDGLAVARILHFAGYAVEVIICEISDKKSLDFQLNLERLPKHDTIRVIHLQKEDDLSKLPKLPMVIDAIFGSGLNRPIQGYWAKLVYWINEHTKQTVAIDIPSGLFSDEVVGGPAIKANRTIGFQVPKLAYFLSENSIYIGKWAIVSIGLLSKFLI
ncbi:MAG: NAD(P)H-hydrate epimerase [Bacteroidota bacterium]